MDNSRFIKVRCIKSSNSGLLTEGKTYWVIRSTPEEAARFWDCCHVYAADDYDAWICNINNNAFNEYFQYYSNERKEYTVTFTAMTTLKGYYAVEIANYLKTLLEDSGCRNIAITSIKEER